MAGGAVCRIAPTVNPGFCLEFFRHLPGLTPEDMETMERTEAAYRALGAQLTYNCTPYLQGNVPRFGEITAYSESSATPYMNSVYGHAPRPRVGPDHPVPAVAAGCVLRTSARREP